MTGVWNTTRSSDIVKSYLFFPFYAMDCHSLSSMMTTPRDFVKSARMLVFFSPFTLCTTSHSSCSPSSHCFKGWWTYWHFFQWKTATRPIPCCHELLCARSEILKCRDEVEAVKPAEKIPQNSPVAIGLQDSRFCALANTSAGSRLTILRYTRLAHTRRCTHPILHRE